jgi:hypothetical protein
MKKIEIVNAGLIQGKGMIDIQQGFAAIRIKIPQGMIQIEEEVLVGHGCNLMIVGRWPLSVNRQVKFKWFLCMGMKEVF